MHMYWILEGIFLMVGPQMMVTMIKRMAYEHKIYSYILSKGIYLIPPYMLVTKLGHANKSKVIQLIRSW